MENFKAFCWTTKYIILFIYLNSSIFDFILKKSNLAFFVKIIINNILFSLFLGW